MTVSRETEDAYRLLHKRVHGCEPRVGDAALSVVAYDRARAAYLAEHGTASRPGVAVWPPTSQTVRAHLGDGSWSQAMARLGLTTSGGRARGTGRFADGDYAAAIRAFLEAAADDGSSVTATSFAAYSTWVKEQKDAGVTRPSGAAVRQHFGGWDAAKAHAEGNAPTA